MMPPVSLFCLSLFLSLSRSRSPYRVYYLQIRHHGNEGTSWTLELIALA